VGHTMRAVVVRAWGGPEQLELAEVPRPDPAPTEVLVRVHAAGVNPADWKSRATGGHGLWNDPPVLGYDVAGVVEEVGPGVTVHRPGDAVLGMPHFPRQAGGYAEYVVAPARQFVAAPPGLDHVPAAALPLAGLTAWQALVDTAETRPGQRVLVHAAAGGFGHLAVQIAKALDLEVVATASAGKHEFVRSLGADEVIDYRDVDFVRAVGPVDAVLDPVGGAYGERSLDVLRPGGVLVSLASPAEHRWAPVAAARGLRAGFMLVEPDRAALAAVTALVAEGRVRPHVAHVLPLERAAEAHELGEAGGLTGKIVLAV
jgi:NADPH:quinone reductase-like Zn-dependent oxidoreductase